MLPLPPVPPLATSRRCPGWVTSPMISSVSMLRTSVPSGTRMTMSSADFPVRCRPWPGCPFRAWNMRACRKSTSVLRPGSASIHTLPPSPPSPPSGPPLGIYFSRRKLTQPWPPRPARTSIFASSTNFILVKPVNDKWSARDARSMVNGERAWWRSWCVRLIVSARNRPSPVKQSAPRGNPVGLSRRRNPQKSINHEGREEHEEKHQPIRPGAAGGCTCFPGTRGLPGLQPDLNCFYSFVFFVAFVVIRFCCGQIEKAGTRPAFRCLVVAADYSAGSTETNLRDGLPRSRNTTLPSASANRVWSRPTPTLSPAWKRVPRWRTRMLPASTRSPPKRLTPRNLGFESRPLRVEPPAFLCAICLALHTGNDIGDLDFGVV